QRQGAPLALLVVFQLHLEELGQLDADAGGARDGDRGELVGAEQLVHVAVGDHVAGGRPAVTGQDDAAGEDQGHDRGGLGGEVGGGAVRGGTGAVGQPVGTDLAEEVDERRGPRTHERGGQSSTAHDRFSHATPFGGAPSARTDGAPRTCSVALL